jgi:hypothetical protein
MKSNDARDVRTTILTIDREAIDWETVQENWHVVRYDMPHSHKGDRYYYPRMHNWYKRTSDYPCYLHTYGPHLYVKYDHSDEIMSLSYQGRPLRHSNVDVRDEEMLPWIMKLLLADYFQRDGRFVSNAHFFLWATADKDFVTGLEIKLNHNWRENENEFVISDQAARLRRLRPSDFEKINEWRRKHRIYYGRFYTDGMAVFKQLKPDQLTRAQLDEGIYELFQGSRTNRASLTFHSVKSLQDLEQTRSYLLNRFIDRFVTYLNRQGLPFQQKILQMRPMHTKPAREMRERQLPFRQKQIYIVDDRINASRKPDDKFAERFREEANKAIEGHDALFAIKSEADLQPGDWVLRIQDYEGDEFDPETGILRDWEDGKADFYARYPRAVKQSLTVNSNTEKRQKQAKRKKRRTWTAEEYLDYSVPSARELKTKLEVCRNQLQLKDAIMFPEDVRARLPQVDMMMDLIFLYDGALVHFDGCNLQFMPVVNNIEEASAFIKAKTGWDLIADILLPSADRYYYDYTRRSTAIEDSTKRPFIISRDFIWEIWEGDARVVHEDDVIRERLEALEEAVLIKKFYPSQPIQDNDLFTAAQLRAYAQFLDQHVREAVISYRDLKDRYGKHIKDERGQMIVKDGGFYQVLGISRETKYRRYLRECLGLPYKSVREGSLFPVYKGIWYDPRTSHYVAGVKDANPQEQERGHTLRKIVVHQGKHGPVRLQEQVEGVFFPMLEVNFVRYRNYTVYPFPFNLIEIWQKIESMRQI